MIESDDSEHQAFGEEIYGMLFEEIFENDSLLVWNPDIVNEYVSVLMKN